jgi:hypothetical protein
MRSGEQQTDHVGVTSALFVNKNLLPYIIVRLSALSADITMDVLDGKQLSRVPFMIRYLNASYG